jgi:hypothetical protein
VYLIAADSCRRVTFLLSTLAVVALVFVLMVVFVLWYAHARLVCCQIDGCTPLFVACQNGHMEVVAVLLAAGASVDAATVCTVRAVMLYLAISSAIAPFLAISAVVVYTL